MRASFENMQRGAAASERDGSGFDRGARAGCRNNQSENGDALGSPARRRLLRERGTSQDAVRKMKVAEPIDVEFLQAERLQNFFVFHFRRPIREVVGHPATTGECRTVNYFCGLPRKCSCERNGKLTGGASAGLAESQPGRTALTPRMRKQRKRQLAGETMQSTDWPAEHSQALRELLKSGISYSRAADAINAKFKTTYSRNAALGRATRMGLAGPERPRDFDKSPPSATAPRLPKLRERCSSDAWRIMPIFETETAELRCAEIVPRHLSLMDLERGDCRYPYGGDEEGEAITFCGHPQRRGTSYCVAHFHLTRGPGIATERAAGTVSLRLVEAA
jgi:GcrA cell cycle regulator